MSQVFKLYQRKVKAMRGYSSVTTTVNKVSAIQIKSERDVAFSQKGKDLKTESEPKTPDKVYFCHLSSRQFFNASIDVEIQGEQ